MKLIAFVLYITNVHKLPQDYIYKNYLKCFDVIDAVMCNNGECLAVCVSSIDRAFTGPKCFKAFLKNHRNNEACQISVLDIQDYKHLDLLQDYVYNIVEMYNYKDV